MTSTSYAHSAWPSQRAYVQNGLAALPIVMLIFVNEVGTGGLNTAAYFQTRGEVGYKNPRVAVRDSGQEPVDPLVSPSDNLDFILGTIKPSMAELARTLNVSRETVYNWKSGSNVSSANAAKLADLAKAAELFAEVDPKIIRQLIRRKISGANFFERVARNDSATESAEVLLTILHREQQQRERISRKLAARKTGSYIEGDFSTPHLIEQG